MAFAQRAAAPARPASVEPVATDAADPGSADLAALVARHQAMVWRYLRLLGADAHEADDLMQDAFVRVAEALQAGERLRDAGAYARGVARNLLLAARRRARRRPLPVDWLDAVDRYVAERPAALEADRLDTLRRCVERLRGRARDAVRWRHFDGLSERETGARLGLGLEGVRSLLKRTRAVLRRCVDRAEQEDA